MSNLWKKIRTGEIQEAGCEKCTNGKIKIAKEGDFGFTYQICGCAVERESLLYSKQLFKYSNLPKRDYEITKWKEDDITFTALKGVLDSDDKPWLFIYGPTGTGKTYAAIVAAQIAILQEKSVYFSTVADLLNSLRPNEFSPQDKVIAQRGYKNADVLILDDIGVEKASVWVREQLYLIVNERWNNDKMTIFTSNFDVENLRTMVSEPVYSRIKGKAIEVGLLGLDKRFQIN